MFLVQVFLEDCTGCRACINVCPVDVYRMGADGRTDPYQAGECVGCMSCVEVCPEKCIEVTEI